MPSPPPNPNRDTLTAGDLARALSVDVKTVHNWVRRGLLTGTRTPGRHLRFQRIEVIRYLRRSGRLVPADVRIEAPAITAVGFDELPRYGVAIESCGGLVQAALHFAEADHDVLVIHVDAFDAQSVNELVAALRRHPVTSGRGLIGVSESPARRRDFITAGGDNSVASVEDVEEAIGELTGSQSVDSGPPTVRAVPRPSGFRRRVEALAEPESASG